MKRIAGFLIGSLFGLGGVVVTASPAGAVDDPTITVTGPTDAIAPGVELEVEVDAGELDGGMIVAIQPCGNVDSDGRERLFRSCFAPQVFIVDGATVEGGGALPLGPSRPRKSFTLRWSLLSDACAPQGALPCEIEFRATTFPGGEPLWVRHVAVSAPPGVPTVTAGTGAPVEEGDGAGRTTTIPVTLSNPVPWPVRVNYETIDAEATVPEDVRFSSGALVIPSGETQATIPLSTTPDTFHEPDEVAAILLSNPVNAVIGGFYGLGGRSHRRRRPRGVRGGGRDLGGGGRRRGHARGDRGHAVGTVGQHDHRRLRALVLRRRGGRRLSRRTRLAQVRTGRDQRGRSPSRSSATRPRRSTSSVSSASSIPPTRRSAGSTASGSSRSWTTTRGSTVPRSSSDRAPISRTVISQVSTSRASTSPVPISPERPSPTPTSPRPTSPAPCSTGSVGRADRLARGVAGSVGRHRWPSRRSPCRPRRRALRRRGSDGREPGRSGSFG